MATLSRELRRILENTVADARKIAEAGAEQALKQLAVHRSGFVPVGTDEEKAREQSLHRRLRAHGKQLGDWREPNGNQELRRLRQACAYEHWNRMLFARFLAENNLLIHPDYDQAVSLEEIKEQAREQNTDWLSIAASYAQKMLLGVFRSDDPVLELALPPETRLALDEKLQKLPTETFMADDSLGWVYQFWQRDEKDRVNKSEVKIGADELPAVTQLFTEDYMVLFLLENTLGAWWTAKRRAEGKDTALPGYTWTYLRLNGDGSPAAGSFDGWPRTTRELRVLDPCMGSGHFLAFALPVLARMRVEEEDLSIKDALTAVLKDNLFGLEIDERCAQIAAFNLALAAWRMAGEHFPLPELNLACCGIGPNTTKDQWIKLGEEIAARSGMPADTNLFGTEDSLLSEPVKRTMESLHELFSQAPVLGSLINPSQLRVDLFQTDYKTVAPLLSAVLKADHATEETRERVIAAAGMVKAGSLLTSKYSLVATNVPFLGGHKQDPELADYLRENFEVAGGNLANAVLLRLFDFLSDGMTVAAVTPQDWMLSGRYSDLRELVLPSFSARALAFLGTRAFETIEGEVVTAGLSIWDRSAFDDEECKPVLALDAQIHRTPPAKANALAVSTIIARTQSDWLSNPNCRITVEHISASVYLSKFARPWQGIKTSDDDRFVICFWELSRLDPNWRLFLRALGSSAFSGREHLLLWEDGRGQLRDLSARQSRDRKRDLQGINVWGSVGIVTNTTGRIVSGLYLGEAFASEVVVLTTRDEHLRSVLAFACSPEFSQAIKRLDKRVSVTTSTFNQVPFDLDRWEKAAKEDFGAKLPIPFSNDPTQWLFTGHPNGSQTPLQVAIARLVGYHWPRQTGSSFPDCPASGPDGLGDFVADNGIVPLSSVSGEASAAYRLRALLAAAYGGQWSAAKLAELLGDHLSLEDWLRDSFFEDHCQLFHQRPFVWHVWDGRKDGFHALVNYHRLAAPNGESRKTLEKLIYTTLGDWITRQDADSKAGVDGADGRLAAALHLKGELEKILAGNKPYDIFVRWKPLDQQPIGWEPDINDGVRLNIRPWLTATLSPGTKPKKDACILRVTPKIPYGKDRGKEPHRKKEDFPWFWNWDEKTDDFAGDGEFDGARWNDLHYKLETKQKARERKQRSGGA